MKRGFTLLEVMLALAIFALAAMAVLQIASGALSNQQILEEKTVAGCLDSYRKCLCKEWFDMVRVII